MIKYLLTLSLFYSIQFFPQDIDSLTFINDFTNVKIKPDSTISIKDSIGVNKNDSLTIKESIVPIQMLPLTETSFIIGRKDFLYNDYRYAGDFLKQFPLTFTQDLGFVGYPSNSFIYGIGNGGVSYLMDGVLWNDRYFNSLDLNLIQSEDVDSIEIVPLPRGFLYGPFNNAVTVNFITRDFVPQAPYSRIKYYEGPDGEALIDGKFNALVMKRWNFSFEVTNRGKDSTYTNTEFSLWQANAKLKYFLSNEINFAAEYRFNHLKRGLSDGINVDSIRQITTDINSIFYDPLQAAVVSPYKNQDLVQNTLVIKVLSKFYDNSDFYLLFNYDHNIDEFKNIQDSLNLLQESNSKSYGTTANYIYHFDLITLQLLGEYRRLNLNSKMESFNFYTNDYVYGIGGILSFNLDSLSKFSVFYKKGYWKDPDLNYNGLGTDINYSLTKDIMIYGGYSIKDNIGINKKAVSLEAGIYFENSKLHVEMKYIINEYFNYLKWNGGSEPFRNLSLDKIDGVSLLFNYKLWLLLLEVNSSYFLKKDGILTKNLPEWQVNTGLFLNSVFFENNLKLKTGINFYYSGKINYYEYYWNPGVIIDPSNRLDFNLFGEIQERAIIYFVWENLFNKKYYITPYFPMPESNIRFGIAWELFN